MHTESDIEKLYEEINEYYEIYGDDMKCLMAKAKLFDIINEYSMAIDALHKALEFDNHNEEILYSIAVEYEKLGYLSLASVYYAKAASEMKIKNMNDDYDQIKQFMSSASHECREIFETLIDKQENTYVFLSICGFGAAKQRYQNLACALSKIASKVIYVCPSAYINLENKATDEQVAEYSLSHMEYTEGVYVVQPYLDLKYGVESYRCIVEKLSSMYDNAVFLVSNVEAFDSLTAIKGKNKIIFDCADDNSDYKNAFWSSPDSYKKEQKLIKMSDDVTCTSVSLFLKKAVIEKHKSVHLSQNAVSDFELGYNSEVCIPDDMKDIPHPIIGYVGVVYQRFDRELFYELARNNQEKSFVIVGSVMNNYIEKKYDNMYFLGSKKHSDLGNYYRNMDICIIPYFDNAKMSMSCDPVKIHEQICCQVPTIVTYMPDTAVDRPMVYHANTFEGFQNHIKSILNDSPSISKNELESYIARNSWISRACHIVRIANGSLFEYEKTENKILSIREKYHEVRDIHPNFGVIYGMASWNADYQECKKYIEKSYKEYPTEFNSEVLEIHSNRIITSIKGRVVPAKNIGDVDYDKCVGCLSCVNICPFGAISYSKDKFGFNYPDIDNQKCTNCGKCFEHCPVNSQIYIGRSDSVCYAVSAKNEIREKSSSGGVFPLLAQLVLSEGGYVAGVVFEEDFLSVKHIVSNKMSDVVSMFESKYMESNVGTVYKEVKKLLHNGNTVLFSGCPCQVAGLYSFLGEKYDNLISVSLVCHGVPGPELYRQHVEYLNKDKKKINKISFRDKLKLGWSPGLFIKYSDNSEYVNNSINDDYIEGFLADLYLRYSCYNCAFKEDLYSDLVLGDFWGIERIVNLGDNLGTSYVSVNTVKGKEYLKKCSLEFLSMLQIPKKQAIKMNRNIRNSVNEPPFKKRFIDNFSDNDFENAYHQTFDFLKFDIILVLWYSNNYGNALTNYALYTALSRIGLSVLAVDNLRVSPYGQFKTFAQRYFELSSKYYPDNAYRHILNSSENFMVGSDQIWNKTFSKVMADNGYFQLSFVPENKNKISYGSSFGQTSDAVEFSKKDYYKKLYQRFNHISTREKFGVSVLKNIFDVDGDYVLDPVFLLDKNDYMQIADNANITINDGNPFVVAYILTPDLKKLEYIRNVRDRFPNSSVIVILDAEPSRIENNKQYFNGSDYEVKTNITPEEFIYYFAHSEYIITDSYHGTCFSMIFEKKYTSIMNRECERFETFKEFEEISDRIVSDVSETVLDNILKEIDYKSVHSKIQTLREKSLKFIESALL